MWIKVFVQQCSRSVCGGCRQERNNTVNWTGKLTNSAVRLLGKETSLTGDGWPWVLLICVVDWPSRFHFGNFRLKNFADHLPQAIDQQRENQVYRLSLKIWEEGKENRQVGRLFRVKENVWRKIFGWLMTFFFLSSCLFRKWTETKSAESAKSSTKNNRVNWHHLVISSPMVHQSLPFGQFKP